jgi:hypothetical protein
MRKEDTVCECIVLGCPLKAGLKGHLDRHHQITKPLALALALGYPDVLSLVRAANE